MMENIAEAPVAGSVAAPTGLETAVSARRRIHTVGLGLAAMLLISVANLCLRGGFAGGPNGISFGTDFAISMGAAQTMRDGQNLYDRRILLATERAYLRRQGLPSTAILPASPYNRTVIRVGNPPLFFRLLGPLTYLPYQQVAVAWILSSYLLLVIGFLGMLSFLGWRKRLVPCLLFLGMPAPFLAAYYGNANVIVFAGMGLAVGVAARYSVVAGRC